MNKATFNTIKSFSQSFANLKIVKAMPKDCDQSTNIVIGFKDESQIEEFCDVCARHALPVRTGEFRKWDGEEFYEQYSDSNATRFDMRKEFNETMYDYTFWKKDDREKYIHSIMDILKDGLMCKEYDWYNMEVEFGNLIDTLREFDKMPEDKILVVQDWTFYGLFDEYQTEYTEESWHYTIGVIAL